MIGYDAVLGAHVVAGVVGFAAMGTTGYFAGRARIQPDSTAVRRYFRPGANLAARAVFLVPVAGVALLYLGHDAGGEATRPWLLAGTGLWVAATGAATAVLWPAERTIQRLVSLLAEEVRPPGPGDPPLVTGEPETAEASEPRGPRFDAAELTSACRRASRAAAVADLAYVAAVVLMVAKPGGG